MYETSKLFERAAIILVGCASCFCNTARSEPVVLNFTGVLDEVVDTTLGSELMNQFHVGDSFSGTLSYDDSVPDNVPGDPNYGSYTFRTAPNGLTITINGQTFSTDPNDVEFLISVQNDYEDTPEGVTLDSISVNVFVGKVIFPVATGPSGGNMSLSLVKSVPSDGPAPSAIEDDSLPSTVDISAWDSAKFNINSDFGEGQDPSERYYYSISGNIVSFSASEQPFFPYIGEPVPGVILDTRLAPDSGGSAGAVVTGGLYPGVRAFVDRPTTWDVLPAQLVGSDYIMTAQDNADVHPIEIDVTVAEGAILHMLVPEHDELLPFDWMNEEAFGSQWVNTGAVVGTSWTTDAQVWSTAVPLPAGTYRFREIPTIRSFYGIAATYGSRVAIDILPGSDNNPVNPTRGGVVPVSIMGSADFDVTQIDVSTIVFGRGKAGILHEGGHYDDINQDGFIDFLGHFDVHDAGIACGDTSGAIYLRRVDGKAFGGSDAISTVACK